HAIHVRRQNESVPMNRSAHGQPVRDTDGDAIALTHAQERPGNLAIDRSSDARAARVIDRSLGDREIEVRTGEHGGTSLLRARGYVAEGGEQQRTTGNALHEAAPG